MVPELQAQASVLASIDPGMWLSLTLVVVSLVGWEWRKVVSQNKAQETLKDQIVALENKMATLHIDHEKLLRAQANEHSDVMRGVTGALHNLNLGINELTHYIRWLGKQQTGNNPPPPISRQTGDD